MPAPGETSLAQSISGRDGPILGTPIAVVIVNYRTPELTLECLGALSGERQRLPRLKAIVVDGGSADGSAAKLRRAAADPFLSDWVFFLPLRINGGFGWANNQAILTLAQGGDAPQFIHLLNPDARVEPGAVARLAEELLAHPRCGAVGSRLLSPDGRVAASAFRFPSAGREFVNAARSQKVGSFLRIEPTVVECHQSTDVDWVTGASMMFRSEDLRECGLFDDGFFLYFEEVELMHRLRRHGWTVRHVPQSRVVHHEGASTGLGEGRLEQHLPSYWYESRRRYFALTGGRGTLIGANLSWVAGRIVASAKTLVGKPPTRGRAGLRELLRVGGVVDRCTGPSVPRWGDPPGSPPAWMSSH
jgi:GT2 family glycosyltransferase